MSTFLIQFLYHYWNFFEQNIIWCIYLLLESSLDNVFAFYATLKSKRMCLLLGPCMLIDPLWHLRLSGAANLWCDCGHSEAVMLVEALQLAAICISFHVRDIRLMACNECDEYQFSLQLCHVQSSAACPTDGSATRHFIRSTSLGGQISHVPRSR